MKLALGLIIGVLIASTFFFICNPVPDPEIIKETIRTTKYKENPKPIAEIPSKPEKIPDTLLIYKDTLYIYADTLFLTDTVFVYDDYFVKRVYEDTLHNDSNAFVFVRDSVYRNRLLNRFSDVQIFKESRIIPGNPLFLSLGAFYVTNPLFNSAGLKAGFENDKNEFNAGFGTGKTFLFEYERKFNIKPLKLKPWYKT